MRLFSFGGYGLALAALALVVFGAIECPPFCSYCVSVSSIVFQSFLLFFGRFHCFLIVEFVFQFQLFFVFSIVFLFFQMAGPAFASNTEMRRSTLRMSKYCLSLYFTLLFFSVLEENCQIERRYPRGFSGQEALAI